MNWFGRPSTRFNPPLEALSMEVKVPGGVRFDKGESLLVTIPVDRDMVLNKGMEIKVTVKAS